MKSLFIAESAAIGVAGLALALFPSIAVSLMFRTSLDGSVGAVVGRGTGVVLLTLGIICWVWRNTTESRTNGRIGVVLFYDISIVAVLICARFADGLTGPALWPYVALHLGLGVWCLLWLFRGPRLVGLA
jgi:hypothetical protein